LKDFVTESGMLSWKNTNAGHGYDTNTRYDKIQKIRYGNTTSNYYYYYYYYYI